MRSEQFFFTRVKKVQDEKGNITDRVFLDSFNLNYVIRTHELDDSTLLILLDDGHEQSDYIKVPKGKTSVEIRKERQWMQSEIVLSTADAKRFRKEFGVEIPISSKPNEDDVIDMATSVYT